MNRNKNNPPVAEPQQGGCSSATHRLYTAIGIEGQESNGITVKGSRKSKEVIKTTVFRCASATKRQSITIPICLALEASRVRHIFNYGMLIALSYFEIS